MHYCKKRSYRAAYCAYPR